jgi:hypothetical protein
MSDCYRLSGFPSWLADHFRSRHLLLYEYLDIPKRFVNGTADNRQHKVEY